jgi:FAD/FMN-containing dehydrogenase
LAASDNVLHTRQLNRFISADWENGIIIAEAGVTLEEILMLAIPQGWFLPVTPGTKYVTLGGAVANDVHGKNHHVRGTFGCHVLRFSLIRSDTSPVVCSSTQNPALFAATVGGLGVTGIIEWVELKLMPIQSSMVDVTTVRFGSLVEFFDLSREFDACHEYTVAWVDCLAQGAAAGRGVFMAGNHASNGTLEISNKRKVTVPFTPPISAINPLTLRAFNLAYYYSHQAEQQKTQVSYDPFFYPLDGVLQWNRIYGSKGFQQYQCVIPDKQAETAMQSILDTIAATGSGSFLAVMKRCGQLTSPGLLSFPAPGISLALDFPQQDTLNSKLFPRLDALVREAGGRLYPAKDAHMSSENFRYFYPLWEQVEQLRDPALLSRFWQRVISST